jgi:phosphoglycolate phosphatase
VFSGLPEAIAGLREHFTVCVITSNEPEPVEAVLRKRGVLVDHVHAGSSIFGKDRAIRSFLRAEGVEPGEAVYVGDEVRDVEAAHKAGVRVISVTWGFNSKKRLKQAQPDYLVDTPAQLMRAIRSAARQNSHI